MTTMTLEVLFRAAVDDGRLVNMTLWRTAQGWQASMSTGFNPWKVRIEDDPIAALRATLGTGTGLEPSTDIFG